MASSKNTFASRIFASRIFAPGIFRGRGYVTSQYNFREVIGSSKASLVVIGPSKKTTTVIGS